MSTSIRTVPFSELAERFRQLGEYDPEDPTTKELERRTRGFLVGDGQLVDWTKTAAWADYVRQLTGATYHGKQFQGSDLKPLRLAFATGPSLHEPFTLHQLLNGQDPATELTYPVEDGEAMAKLAYLSLRLGERDRGFHRDDLDAQQRLIDQVTGKANLSPNVRAILKDRDKDGEEGSDTRWRLDAARKLLQGKPEGFSMTQGAQGSSRPFADEARTSLMTLRQ